MVWKLLITVALIFVTFSDASFEIHASHGNLEIKTIGQNGEVTHYEKTHDDNNENIYVPQKRALPAHKSFHYASMVGMMRRSKRHNIVDSCTISTINQDIFVNNCNATIYNLKVCSGSCPANEIDYFGCRMSDSRELEVDLHCPDSTTINPSIMVKDANQCECKKLPKF
eukprot:TCONS_00064586-protein